MKRLRLVGTLALALGVVSCISVVLTRSLGYAPDTSVASLFAALWPAGLVLATLGALLCIAVWILQGFAPPPAPASDPTPRRAHLTD